jgi:aspartyl-tRNA(Asn)/glutamyl-tRNA(Gln) amidotransferase subunit A
VKLPRHLWKKGHEWRTDLAQKKVSGRELVAEYCARIAKDKTNAFLLATDPEEAMLRADESGKKAGPLAGIPIGIKDNLVTKGVRTTCASRILAQYSPPYSAHVVERLEEVGAISLGKCNMDEFAMGSSNENSAYGPVHLPQDSARVPGGSSGGSAAAVAGGLSVMSLGSDTGGSVRQPASFCGLVGMKPTYGRVSRFGLIAFASSLDQVGPLTLDAQDNADLLECIAGHDPRDSTSYDGSVPQWGREIRELRSDSAQRNSFLKGLRIGLPAEFFAEGLEASVRKAVDQSLRSLEKAGAKLVPVTLPHSKYALAVYYVVAVSEASANLARFDGVRFGPRVLPKGQNTSLEEMYEATRGALFGPEVKRRILLGTFTLSSGYYDAYYRKACQVRNLIAQDFARCFSEVDVIAGPTTPTVSFLRGAKTDDPMSMYLSDIYTVPVNLAGVPSLSLPCGVGEAGLPVGLQLIAKPFDESTLLKTAASLEQLMDEGR